MIAFLVRSIGFLLFAASFIALIADGVRSLAADALVMTALGQVWFTLDAPSLNLAQAVVQRYVHPYIWDPIAITILTWPAFAVGGGLGLALMLLGTRRRRRTGA